MYMGKHYTCSVVLIKTSLYLAICSPSTTNGDLLPSQILKIKVYA